MFQTIARDLLLRARPLPLAFDIDMSSWAFRDLAMGTILLALALFIRASFTIESVHVKRGAVLAGMVGGVLVMLGVMQAQGLLD